MSRTNANLNRNAAVARGVSVPRDATKPAQAKAEQIKTLDAQPLSMDDDDMFNPGELAAADGTEKPPAVDFEEIKSNPGPPVARFRVTQGGRVQTQRNGHRTEVRSGKVLDANNFDIALMREQGIVFEPLV